MTGYFKLFLSLGTFFIGAFASCPTKDIGPCKCHINTKQIRCEGHAVTNLDATKLSAIEKDWDYLYIYDTKLVEIKANTFGANFKRIFIHSNNDLIKIEDKAFGTSSPEVLSIIKNSKLDDNENLFKLIRSMGGNLKTLELNQNAITKIPDKAFIETESNSNFPLLAHIRLDEQKGETKLTTIGAKAFTNLPSLTQLSLDKNGITTIGEDGIDLRLTTGDSTKRVLVFLSDNELKETALSIANIKYDKQKEWTLGLILENNEIHELKGEFIQLINEVASKKGNTVFLASNKVEKICDCKNVKVIADLMNNNDLANNIRGIDSLECSSTKIKECK